MLPPDTLLMVAGLVFLFLICFIGSGPIPMPLTATVMWLGQFDFPFLVIIFATLGTMVGWICLQGVMLRWIQKRPYVTSRIPPEYQKFFLRRTGFWLFMLNAFPFPLDFVRYLALLNNYSRTKLLVILTVSRMLRYSTLALAGSILAENQIMLWTVMILLMVWPLAMDRWMKRFIGKMVGQS